MSIPWETVHIFISSTFNDMHAERDYLVKRVFPQLREWCENRKLRLVDIDLRWGVTEQDATNQNVVKVCLDRIDDCRPFFLCFLGQRRGWVPKEEEISAVSFSEFPALKEYAGKASVTEMEILHALVNPLHRSRVRDPKRPGEYYEPSKYAFFYLREDSYLAQLPTHPPQLRQTYTNEGVEKESERLEQDQQLKRWREVEIPNTKRPVRHYRAQWNPHLSTPELLLPLQCLSKDKQNVQRWQSQWGRAGIAVSGLDVTANPVQAKTAYEYNQMLSSGRLADFLVEEQPLSQVIVADLQAAIAARFPDHTEMVGESDLQKELDQQEQFLYSCSEGFIEREGDFDDLDAYVQSDSRQLFVLTAPGGMGKSSLLAKWIDRYRIHSIDRTGASIHFRFIGQSDRSTSVDSLLRLVIEEIDTACGGLELEIPSEPQKIRQFLLSFLEAASGQGRLVVVFDALNQLETGLSDLGWLPYDLPENVKLIVSIKGGEMEADRLLASMAGQAIFAEVKPFENLIHRHALVNAYLSMYLKQLDQKLLEALISLPGASNPLYLKVVLSELRIFGAFANLGEKIRSDFGETPVSAFNAVLNRLENDPAYSSINPKDAVPLLFGLLAHSRQGLSVDELVSLFIKPLNLQDGEQFSQAVADTIYLYLRQVRPFLAHRDGRYDFFFESFKLAAQERYAGTEKLCPARPKASWHRLLAEYFQSLPVWQPDRDGKIPQRHKLVEQPYQQANAGLFEELVVTLTSFSFLEAKLSAFVLEELVADYDLGIRFNPSQELRLVRDALRLSSHVLREDPAQLAPQLLGRLLDFNQPGVRRLLEEAKSWAGKPWLRPLSVCLVAPGGPERFTLEGHLDPVAGVAISPDGRWAVSSGGENDNRIMFWDLRSGIRRFARLGHPFPAGLVFITDDCKRAVTACDRNTIVWELETGVSLVEVRGQALAVSADGNTVLFRVENKPLQVWNLVKNRYRVLPGQWIRSIRGVVSANGRLGITTADDCTLKVWDLDELELLWILKGHSSPVQSVGMTVDGRVAVSVSSGESIKVWDLAIGKERFICGEASDNYGAVVISPDGQLVAGAVLKTIKVWELEHGTEYCTLTGHTGSVRVMAFTPDGKRIISGADDSTLKVWDLVSGTEVSTLTGHSGIINDVAIRRDGKLAISASDDYTLKVWDLEGTYQSRAAAGHQGEVNVVVVQPDGKRVVSGADDGLVKVWKLETTSEQFSLSANSAGVSRLAVTPDGRLAVSSSWDGSMNGWDLIAGTRSFTLEGHSGAIYGLAITPNGRLAVSASGDQTVKVWDLATGTMRFNLTGHTEGVTALALSPDGQLAVSGSRDKTVRVWDLTSGRERYILMGHEGGIFAVAVTPDGRYAVSGSEHNQIKVWDLASGTERFDLSGDWIWGYVNGIAISPDGRNAVATAFDEECEYNQTLTDYTLKIWDLTSGKLIKKLDKHTGEMNPANISPDGRWVISASKDKTIRVWDLVRGECVLYFAMDTPITCTPAVAWNPFRIIAGDALGKLYFLVVEGLNTGS
jgi:WD40 repeat protein